MGFRDKRQQLLAEKEARSERDASPDEQFEYHALNLDKVPGMALETKFNELGAKGWRFVAEAKGYAVFKRRRPGAE